MKKSRPQFFVYKTSQEAWSAMLKRIKKAEHSIYWEQYIFVDDAEGKVFVDILKKKSREGVDVKLIFDGLGSWFNISSQTIEDLKDAGVEILFFNERKKLYRGILKRIFTRTHRKILVIDEKIGFIGGVNIEKRMKDWLDFHVEIQGTPVHSLLRAFAKMYIISGGKKSNVKKLLKQKKKRFSSPIIKFIYDEKRKNGHSGAKRIHLKALKEAKKRVVIFTPYYFPDKKLLYALWKARKRGIKVDILIPFRSDIRIATYVAYGFLSLLDSIGIKIHMSKTMMHGKGVIVDNAWAMVGSSNFEPSSFYDNYEANIKINDKKTVKSIVDTLNSWIHGAKKFDAKRWEKRGNISKFLEWFSLKLYQIWYGKEKHPEIKVFKKKFKSKKRKKKN